MDKIVKLDKNNQIIVVLNRQPVIVHVNDNDIKNKLLFVVFRLLYVLKY